MPTTSPWLYPNVLPSALLDVGTVSAPREFRDLVALSTGNDFLLQVSNPMCAEVAFRSLNLLWMKQPLDASAVAALRASGATFTSRTLQRLVAAPAGVGETLEVLLLFGARDVLFDAVDRCRVRLSVRVAVGSSFQMPAEPGLGRRLLPGEAVETIRKRSLDELGLRSSAIVAGELPSVGPPVMRTMSGSGVDGIEILNAPEIDRAQLFELDRYVGGERHLELGDRTSFDVVAWLGSATLEIPAVFAARDEQISKTITVAADLSDSSAVFTDLSHDPALLLSPSDPLGLVQWTTYSLRRRGSVNLVDDVSLVGGPSTAKAGHLGPLVADTYPTRTGACSLNIAATVVPGRLAARSTIEFLGGFRYGVVWSADAVRLLVRYCWEVGAYPRRIPQTDIRQVIFNGVQQTVEAISDFQLEELEHVELEFDSNGRRDVLYTGGSARVIPRLVRLRDGTELFPSDPNDPMFRPSEPIPWAAVGELIEGPVSAASPDLLVFLKGVTNGVTSRLGRPFCNPPSGVLVTHSRISAPAQRIALLVE